MKTGDCMLMLSLCHQLKSCLRNRKYYLWQYERFPPVMLFLYADLRIGTQR